MRPPAVRPAPAGRPMDLRLIGFAGHRRLRHEAAAKADLEAIVEELVQAGPYANISLAARISGVARDTLHRRLRELRQDEAA